MAMIKKSITITDQQNAWIEAQMAQGRYGSDSELIRDLIRERQTRLAEVEVIRAKLIEAEQSVEKHGLVKKTVSEIKADLVEKARKDGRL